MDPRELSYRRAWARIAGLMYWLVFAFDFAGMNLGGKPSGHWLSLAGGLFTCLLAYGLYAAVAPVSLAWARTAFGFRLAEIVLTLIAVLAGFPVLRADCASSKFGVDLLAFTDWLNATGLAAFVFTIGSTLFFILFLRGRLIPTLVSGFGLLASLIAFSVCLAHLIHPPIPVMSMAAWAPMILAELAAGAWLLFASVRYPSNKA